MSASTPIQYGSAQLKHERALYRAEFEQMRSIGTKFSTRTLMRKKYIHRTSPLFITRATQSHVHVHYQSCGAMLN